MNRVKQNYTTILGLHGLETYNTLAMLKYLSTALLAFPLSVQLTAQVTVFDPMSSQIEFISQRTYSADAGKKYNSPVFYNHPDFGKLTFDAPFGKNVVEDLSKRTDDSRYYVDLDKPTFFYIQKSSGAINLYQNGTWRAIDPTLHPVSAQVYESGIQHWPTKLDLANKLTSFRLNESEFKFNHYALKVIHNDNSQTMHQANWSQARVGNEGAYITDIFPGIDMKIIFSEGKIKSDFIIRENLHVKRLIFKDQLEVPAHLNGFVYTDEFISHGPVIFEDIHTGEAVIKFNSARCYDASANKQSWLNPYTLQGNALEILCDSAQLNDPSKVYPITIDPLVTVVGPVNSAANIIGSRPTPASCTNTINVTFPGGTTPWDVSAGWVVVTDYCYLTSYPFWGIYDDCWRSEARIWITSSCGGGTPAGFPGTIWTCSGCNSIGTWNPVLPFASSGTQTLAQCYTPSCSNQTLSFTINSNRTYCAGNGTYDNCNWATNYCNYMNSWNVTVQGRNAETLANTTTGNGSTTIAAATCASGTTTLNPAALYGVPGYNYAWNTGATSNTLTVANGPATYTATVTDACGTVRTATFIITCPLALELGTFEAAHSGGDVQLSWQTNFEKENHHFSILRAGSDLQFEEIGQVPGLGDSQSPQFYSFMDRDPLNGISYYQLASVDINGLVTLSDIRSIETKLSGKPVSVSPNPNSGSFSLELSVPKSGSYLVQIVSSDGRIVYQSNHQLQKGHHVLPMNKVALQKGTYHVRAINEKTELQEKFVVE